jgi:hypothetical protein
MEAMTMTLELPDDLRPLDEQLKAALAAFAPPADLDAKIVSHVSRRSRLQLRLVPTSRVAKGIAIAAAASLLAAVGYVADRQMNGGQSSGLFGDVGRLVATNGRMHGIDGEIPSAYQLQDDVEYFPAGPGFKLDKEVTDQKAASSQTIGLDNSGNQPYIILDVEAEESKTGELMVGAGVNSNAGLVGTVVSESDAPAHISSGRPPAGALRFQPGVDAESNGTTIQCLTSCSDRRALTCRLSRAHPNISKASRDSGTRNDSPPPRGSSFRRKRNLGCLDERMLLAIGRGTVGRRSRKWRRHQSSLPT